MGADDCSVVGQNYIVVSCKTSRVHTGIVRSLRVRTANVPPRGMAEDFGPGFGQGRAGKNVRNRFGQVLRNYSNHSTFDQNYKNIDKIVANVD